MKKLKLVALLSLFALVQGCSKDDSEVNHQASTEHSSLHQHSELFAKQIIEVTDGVHVAVGYGLANSIMIEGPEGLIIVDTMESIEEAQAVWQEFRKISDKPVKAIVYTHNHTDHIFGSTVFAEDKNVDVIAHESTQYYIDRMINVIRPIINLRSTRMFGSRLNEQELVNAGIGPKLGSTDSSSVAALKPNVTFKDSLKLTVAGVDIEFYHAPGETEDQLMVWLPKQKVLMPGDNIYQTFPNLYTIRGTYYRDVTKWVASLDKMRSLKADYVVPSHTLPIVGADNIEDTLTVYRDGIQYVHDQTVRLMNQGLTEDVIAERVQLPDHLKQHPYLQEFYGKVEWSVRSIFNGYLGWFDGNATSLLPLAQKQHAQNMVKLAGGIDAFELQIQTSLDTHQYQWALELLDHLLALQPDNTQATSKKAFALSQLAKDQQNPNARHYYYTQAMELEEGETKSLKSQPTTEFLHSLPLDGIFKSMAVALKAEDTIDMHQKVVFSFPDVNQQYSLIIRRGIAEVLPYGVANPDNEVRLHSNLWKGIVAGNNNPLVAFASGDIQLSGSKLDFINFLRLFDIQQ